MPTLAQNLGGTITSPTGTSVTAGFPSLITNLTRLAIIVAGILILINFLVAGYDFITAGGDPKKIQNGWAKVWQSLIGLLIIVSAFAVISIVETVIFGGSVSILKPTITGPGTP